MTESVHKRMHHAPNSTNREDRGAIKLGELVKSAGHLYAICAHFDEVFVDRAALQDQKQNIMLFPSHFRVLLSSQGHAFIIRLAVCNRWQAPRNKRMRVSSYNVRESSRSTTLQTRKQRIESFIAGTPASATPPRTANQIGVSPVSACTDSCGSSWVSVGGWHA